MDTGKTFDQIQQPLMRRTFSKWEREGNGIKNINKNLQLTSYLTVKNYKLFW